MLPRLSIYTLHISIRSFSASTSVHRGVSSRIGKQPIPIPATVTFNTSSTAITVTGPRGATSVPLEPYMTLTHQEPTLLTLSVEDPTVKKQRQMWGTTRTLIANAMQGISEGFTVSVYLVGRDYRVKLEHDPRATTTHGPGNMRLHLKFGCSRPIYIPIPEHIDASIPKNAARPASEILLGCNDKQKLGLFAAKIREWRKPDSFNGRGIVVGKETIRIRRWSDHYKR